MPRRRVARYPVRPYRRTPVPAGPALHLMNRMGYGWSVATFRQLRGAGGPSAWFEQQLRPDSIEEDPLVGALDSWFPENRMSPGAKYQRGEAEGGQVQYNHGVALGSWSMLRRMYSRRQVLESMVELWSHHFHVSAFGGRWWVSRVDYDATIRTHALGRFDELLEAVTLHPAMLVHLDNFRSERNAPNENHGRELLELHTVGSGYDEEMVRSSAVILSGWTVDWQRTFAQRYDTGAHTTGPVRVLGFSETNAAADGRAMSRRYLRYLAHHPNTARTVARKLALRFVSDTPSEALIERLATTYLASGTSIPATLRALVGSWEFRRSAGRKVRTPVDDMIATVRSQQVRALRPTHGDSSFTRRIAYLHGGAEVFSWPRPDGEPLTGDHWSSATRMLGSFRMHWGLGSGYNPKVDVRYRRWTSWLPQRRIRFDAYVDHLSRVMLGRRSTSLVLKTCCQATGVSPGTIVTRRHPVCRYLFPRLVAALLDSPAQMTR